MTKPDSRVTAAGLNSSTSSTLPHQVAQWWTNATPSSKEADNTSLGVIALSITDWTFVAAASHRSAAFKEFMVVDLCRPFGGLVRVLSEHILRSRSTIRIRHAARAVKCH